MYLMDVLFYVAARSMIVSEIAVFAAAVMLAVLSVAILTVGFDRFDQFGTRYLGQRL